MAVNDETIRYFPGAVSGTAAYDLSRYERFDYGTSAPETEETYEEEIREPVSRGGAHAAAQTNLKIRPVSVIGVLLTAAIAVLALLANLRLTAITAETVELEQQLEALEDERTQLQIRYETALCRCSSRAASPGRMYPLLRSHAHGHGPFHKGLSPSCQGLPEWS